MLQFTRKNFKHKTFAERAKNTNWNDIFCTGEKTSALLSSDLHSTALTKLANTKAPRLQKWLSKMILPTKVIFGIQGTTGSDMNPYLHTTVLTKLANTKAPRLQKWLSKMILPTKVYGDNRVGYASVSTHYSPDWVSQHWGPQTTEMAVQNDSPHQGKVYGDNRVRYKSVSTHYGPDWVSNTEAPRLQKWLSKMILPTKVRYMETTGSDTNPYLHTTALTELANTESTRLQKWLSKMILPTKVRYMEPTGSDTNPYLHTTVLSELANTESSRLQKWLSKMILSIR